MEVSKGYHCAYQNTSCHIAFPVKYRKALLQEEVVNGIKKIAEQIQERYGLEIEQMGCDCDHIHLLCGAHPKQICSWINCAIVQKLDRRRVIEAI